MVNVPFLLSFVGKLSMNRHMTIIPVMGKLSYVVVVAAISGQSLEFGQTLQKVTASTNLGSEAIKLFVYVLSSKNKQNL